MVFADPSWPRASEWLAADISQPDLMVTGVPTSVASISPSSAHLTPAAFRSILSRFSTFHSEPEVSLTELRALDNGDWDVAGLSAEQAQSEIQQLAGRLPANMIHAFIGGDNSITRPLLRGLRPDLRDVGVLTLDAHHDVRTLDSGPTNGTPIRGLLEDGLPPGRVAQVGIHDFANSDAYRRYCDENDIAVFTMQQVDEWGIDETVEVALDHLAHRVGSIYVDFDIDVLDRAFAPGCPGSRPGGMTPRQLARAAFICGRHPSVIGADFVEVDVSTDIADVTIMAMATTFLAFVAGLVIRPEEVDG